MTLQRATASDDPRGAVVVWFRLDLRLADNPALASAVARGLPVVPLYIWAPEEEGTWPPGAASRWWLHRSLVALDAQLRAAGSRLVLRRGPTADAMRAIVEETGARVVLWNDRHEPSLIERDAHVRAMLEANGIDVDTFNGSLLFGPRQVLTKSGDVFRVFTAFWNACREQPPPALPSPAPTALRTPPTWPGGATLDSFELQPRVAWDDGLRETWTPGAAGAAARLDAFLDEGLAAYPSGRDRPAGEYVSSLSPHLHFGEISPRTVWHAVQARARDGGPTARGAALRLGADSYLRELGWREFSASILYHYPRITSGPFRREFEMFPWREDAAAGEGLAAWQRGQTGYPIVDAGMRQLWRTGWMHNRARMVVASFIVKNLLVHWEAGARWFWDTLVDADLANNIGGWQWVAGCGTDAAPFFRIFNPVIQGEKFDPAGDYVRRWVPELARLPERWIHRPSMAPEGVLRVTGITLGVTYPRPIVDHRETRRRALDAFRAMRFVSTEGDGEEPEDDAD